MTATHWILLASSSLAICCFARHAKALSLAILGYGIAVARSVGSRLVEAGWLLVGVLARRSILGVRAFIGLLAFGGWYLAFAPLAAKIRLLAFLVHCLIASIELGYVPPAIRPLAELLLGLMMMVRH